MPENMSARGGRRCRIKVLILLFLFALVSMAANAVENPRPVFVKAMCNGKVSSNLLSSFKEAIRTSQKYQLVSTLDDNGRMDVVLEIQMRCTERDNAVAVATVYAVAKCFGLGNCQATVDGASLNVALCDSKVVEECGRAIFKAFEDYLSRPNPAQLKLN